MNPTLKADLAWCRAKGLAPKWKGTSKRMSKNKRVGWRDYLNRASKKAGHTFRMVSITWEV